MILEIQNAGSARVERNGDLLRVDSSSVNIMLQHAEVNFGKLNSESEKIKMSLLWPPRFLKHTISTRRLYGQLSGGGCGEASGLPHKPGEACRYPSGISDLKQWK